LLRCGATREIHLALRRLPDVTTAEADVEVFATDQMRYRGLPPGLLVCPEIARFVRN